MASKFLGTGGYIFAAAANGGITSGTQGSTDQLVGFFADSGMYLNSTGKVSLFNVNTGFTTGVTLPFLWINQFGGYGGDVLIDALTPAAQPSSITTTGPVAIKGGDIVINSTVNFQPGINTTNLDIVSTKSFTTGPNGALAAGINVNITNSGAGGINTGASIISGANFGGGSVNITNKNIGASTTIGGLLETFTASGGADDVNVTVNGPLTMTGGAFAWDNVNINNLQKNAVTMFSGPNFEAFGGNVNIGVTGPLTVANNLVADSNDVNIIQNSLTGGQTTTISGNVFAEGTIFIENNGGSSTNLNISGDLTVGPAGGTSQVIVLSGGNLSMGKVSAVGGGDNIFLEALGTKVMLNGPETAGNDWEIFAPSATTKLVPTAVIQAGDVVTLTALNFTGVNAAGNPYVNAAEKPAAQIIANFVNATLYGSINGPIAGNTNWPLNAMWIKALDPSFPVFLSVSAIGGGFQAINLGITGDAFVNSGLTRTPFDTVGFVSSILLPPPLVANGGSSLILQATGNMDVVGNGAPFLLAPNAFEFPGGVVFIAGGVLTSQVPIYNAWTTNALQFQGIFKQGASIVDNSYNATNTNSWVNYSVLPVTGPGNSYRIVQSVPGLFQFVLDPLIVHKNTYTLVLTGTPTNFCPGGFPPYCP